MASSCAKQAPRAGRARCIHWGPTLQRKDLRHSLLVGSDGGLSCALGVAINDENLDGKGGAICKYWNQRHVDLRLSEDGRCALSLEFGLSIVPEID